MRYDLVHVLLLQSSIQRIHIPQLFKNCSLFVKDG